MSTLDRAIFAEECDELPSAAEPQWETDSDATSDDDVELRGDEAEEETQDVAVAAEREESIFERKEDSSGACADAFAATRKASKSVRFAEHATICEKASCTAEAIEAKNIDDIDNTQSTVPSIAKMTTERGDPS